MRNLIILFTRFPEPGATKTRLIPALGRQGAADIQRQMTENVVQQVASLSSFALKIYYQGSSEEVMNRWLGLHEFVQQSPGDLGQRMRTAMKHSFRDGFQKVTLIGADCPGLSTDIVKKAMDHLERHKLVLGPAMDGGYYLIGLSQTCPYLFEDISWGTGSVLAQTIKRAKEHNLSIKQLEPLHDIDRPEDLKHFDHYSSPE